MHALRRAALTFGLPALVLILISYRLWRAPDYDAPLYFDDQLYYQTARGIWQGELPPADWSPGFAPFYALLANPWLDRESAFLAARFGLAALLATLVFAALRRVARVELAAFFALWIAASHATASYFVIRLAVAVLVVAGLVLVGRRPGRASLTVLLLGAGTWIRPELVFAGGGAAMTLREWTRGHRGWISLSALLALGLLGYHLIAPNRYESRSWTAFGQHYAWGLAERDEWSGDPWTEWRTVVERDFQDADGIGAALLENPPAFGRHLRHNLALFPRELLKAIAPGRGSVPTWIAALLVVVFVAAGAAGYLADATSARARLAAARPQLLYAASVMPVALIWMVVRPRADFLFGLTPCVFLLLAMSIETGFSIRLARRERKGAGKKDRKEADVRAQTREDRPR